MSTSPRARTSGFTLIELVVLIVLLGIVSVTALARLPNTSTFTGVAFAHELRSALRFAQKFALASGCDVEVNIDSAARSYALQLRADAVGAASSCLGAAGAFGSNPLNNPATGQPFAGAAPAGVAMSGNLATVFNRQGGASVAGSVSVNGDTVSVVAISGLVR